jgi:hypothetical protein
MHVVCAGGLFINKLNEGRSHGLGRCCLQMNHIEYVDILYLQFNDASIRSKLNAKPSPPLSKEKLENERYG